MIITNKKNRHIKIEEYVAHDLRQQRYKSSAVFFNQLILRNTLSAILDRVRGTE